MTRPARPRSPRGTGRAPAPPVAKPPPLDEEVIDTSDLGERILMRPDGYYWLAPDGRQEIGPFDSFAEAMADMDSGDAGGWVPGETLAEAESELGLADWIDPDSGLPAEGQAPPHLDRE
jgi:hypothetical protein